MTTVGEMLAGLRPEPPARRMILAAIADTHAGHKLALLNPDTSVFDEDKDGNLIPWPLQTGPTQAALWPWYCDDVRRTAELADGCPIVLLHNGDICQGGNGRGRELVSSRLADQYEIAFRNLDPWLALPNLERIIMVKGTAYHELEEGSAALTVAARVRGTGMPVDVPYHAKPVIYGVRTNLSHHGPPPGVRNWLKGNIARLYAQSIMDDCLVEGHDPPALILRAHYHTYISEIATRRARGKTWRTQIVIQPSYSFIDDYARKVAKSPERATAGMVAFEIENGQCSLPHEFMRTVDFTTKEVLYAS
jgi:hypothetical protein